MSNGRHHFAMLDETTWNAAAADDPLDVLRMSVPADWPVPQQTAVVSRSMAEHWGILPPRPVPRFIADLLPAPRPPAEIARHHALLAPEATCTIHSTP